MEVYVLNRNFETTSIVDSYTSLIWTDRFNKAGDFELYLPTSKENLDRFQPDYYLWIKNSEHMMIIEDIKTTSDTEEGNNLTVTGRSLESILDRRIVWESTEFDGSLQDAIETLIDGNITAPSITERAISNFIFEASTDPAITTLTLEAQYNGETLYEIITNLCEEKKIGFKVTLNDSNQFVFKLYNGSDRSYEQTDNVFVVFSPRFENIINSEYREIKSEYKNIMLVYGKDSKGKEKTVAAGDVESTGLDRRETYFQANDKAEKTGNFENQLKEKGVEELKKYKVKKEFEGEVETTKMFIYGIDYFLGDIVELEDEYDRQKKTRVVEFVMNQDDEGYKAYPSFEIVDDDETEETISE